LRSAAAVEDLRAFALGLLEQCVAIEVLAVERRVGAHQHRAEVGEGERARSPSARARRTSGACSP
jgi:hypothetical protein